MPTKATANLAALARLHGGLVLRARGGHLGAVWKCIQLLKLTLPLD